MTRKCFSNEQIAFALRQAENGATVDDVCRKMGVSEPTLYHRKKQFVGMGVPESAGCLPALRTGVSATLAAKLAGRLTDLGGRPPPTHSAWNPHTT